MLHINEVDVEVEWMGVEDGNKIKIKNANSTLVWVQTQQTSNSNSATYIYILLPSPELLRKRISRVSAQCLRQHLAPHVGPY